MKNIDEHIDLIERYLYDDLTQEELEEFNDLLRQDAEFNKLFYEMDHLLDGIRRSAKQTTVEEKLARLEEALPFKSSHVVGQESTNAIKRIIDSINFQVDHFIAKLFNLDREEINVVSINPEGRTSILTFTRRVKLIAASSIVMIFLSIFLFYTRFSEISTSQLYAENYKKPELTVINLRSAESEEKGDQSQEDILNQAHWEFNQSNYGNAITQIEKFPDLEKSATMKYCAALSYMEIEDFERAVELWILLELNDDIVWKEHAKWYLSLCSIKTGNMDEAKEYLKSVTEMGGIYQDAASELIRKIK